MHVVPSPHLKCFRGRVSHTAPSTPVYLHRQQRPSSDWTIWWHVDENKTYCFWTSWSYYIKHL